MKLYKQKSSNIDNRGLFASKNIKKGTKIIYYTGKIITKKQTENNPKFDNDKAIYLINLNNRYMGMVRQWQEFFYEGRYAMSYMDAIPNFAKLAESFGHIGMVIDKPENLENDLKTALNHKNRLVFVDVITDQTENVYPMIVSGKGHHEMHLAPSANEDIELA